YERGAYTASFAGFFPAKDPQLVFLVKLDRPRGEYYGGLAAAPVTRATLAAALAARNTPLDRRAVARKVQESRATREQRVGAGVPAVRFAALGGDEAAHVAGPFIFVLDGAPLAHAESASEAPRPVPRVAGLAIRDAVRRLHAQGFRVQVEGTGPVKGTIPAAGAAVRPGETVRVLGQGDRR